MQELLSAIREISGDYCILYLRVNKIMLLLTMPERVKILRDNTVDFTLQLYPQLTAQTPNPTFFSC